jgi:hypothetical protein
MTQIEQSNDHGYISAFLRDAIRVRASDWMVTNVVRLWQEHQVPVASIRAALDEVLAERSLDSQLISSYRDAVEQMLTSGLIPMQRCGEPETHDVTVYCRACDDLLIMGDDDAVLVVRLSAFTTEHATCPSFAVKTHQRVS